MKATVLLPLLLLASCQASSSPEYRQAPPEHTLVNKQGRTVETRFATPPGFARVQATKGSFAAYLRTLPLESDGAVVHLYNGAEKNNADAHAAVVRMDIGSQNLQQCADAVMRLRAEYLFAEDKAEQVHFNFTNGFRADYKRWMNGERIVVKNNNAVWVRQSAGPDNSHQALRRYLDVVFSYAGTLSLERELKPVAIRDMQPGDVLIRGGSPGHAVIVVDMAVNDKGQKLYMLAQSYMPAQDIHILRNPAAQEISPWYVLPQEGSAIITPEWEFSTRDLRRFAD